MTPESAAAIKRAILPAAAATYRNALSARSNGCIDQWMDNELGDRDFYLSVLNPLIEARKWNEDVALVKADMTDVDAVRIFDADAKDWMNITEVVSKLRTDYLRKKRMSDINFYAGQHNGSENPQYVRYQHGLLGYFNGLTGIYNYEFAIGDSAYNDIDCETYKPMAISYLCRSGLLETFEYLGFREAVDDIRYMTLLKRLCRDAGDTGVRENMVAARKALLWIAKIDRNRMDLNAIRQEAIEHILKLQKLLANN